MPDDDGKITPNEPKPDDGVGDISPVSDVSHPDGSDGDGDFAKLAEQFGVDLDTVPEDARSAVELALRTAENAVHNLREEDSLEMDGLKQKADLYDRMQMASPPAAAPVTPLPAGPSAPVQEALFTGSEIEAAVGSDDPEALARVLNKGVAAAITKANETLGAQRLAPIEKALTTIVEMTMMDNDYPGWKKDLPLVRQVLSIHPEYSIKQAYEGSVIVPRYTRDKKRSLDGLTKARDDKRAAIKNAPKDANARPTQDAEKVYDTDRDAILAAIEEVNAAAKK
jgi:hypothetical protein